MKLSVAATAKEINFLNKEFTGLYVNYSWKCGGDAYSAYVNTWVEWTLFGSDTVYKSDVKKESWSSMHSGIMEFRFDDVDFSKIEYLGFAMEGGAAREGRTDCTLSGLWLFR